ISGNMLLDHRAVDAPRRKLRERGGKRVRLRDERHVAGLGRVHVASFDPAGQSESLRWRRTGRWDGNARGEGQALRREERDRSFWVGIANTLGPVDDADALSLPGGQTRDERNLLAHDEEIWRDDSSIQGVGELVGRFEIDGEAARLKLSGDGAQDFSIVSFPSRGMRQLPIDAPAMRRHARVLISASRAISSASRTSSGRSTSMTLGMETARMSCPSWPSQERNSRRRPSSDGG